MRNILTIIIALVLIGVPCGTHAAQTDWSNLDSGLIVRTAIQANDTELYSILSGTTPTLGPIIIGGTGDSWLELLNNTSLVDDITGKYGIRFSNGVLQQIINGTPSSIGSGGSGITEVATDPTVNDLTQGQVVTSQASGDMFYRSVTDRLYTYTGSAVLNYLLTISPTPTDGNSITTTDGFIDCPDVNCSYYYASGAIPELTATADALYTFDNWTGDATDTSTTTNPDNMTMSAAKTVGGAFSATALVCSATPTLDFNGDTGSAWLAEATNYYVGMHYTPVSAISVCNVEVELQRGGGDLTGKTVTVTIWSLTGDDLNAVLGTSDTITGESFVTLGYFAFNFATSVPLTGSTPYGITIDIGGVDAVNILNIFYGTSTDAVQELFKATVGGVATMYPTLDWSVKVYGE